jgi:hypothetical protein
MLHTAFPDFHITILLLPVSPGRRF